MPKITALQSETSPTNDDFLAIVDNASGTTKKVTKADLLKGQALTNLNGGTTAGPLVTSASGGVSVPLVQTQTNTGPGGGAFNYISFGNVKFLWINISMAVGATSTGTSTITFPSGFFTSAPSVFVTNVNGSGQGLTSVAYISGSISASAVPVSIYNTAGSTQTYYPCVFAIGT